MASSMACDTDANSPEEICLQHCTDVPQHFCYSLYIEPTHYLPHQSKIHKLQHLITILLQNMFQIQICPSETTNTAYAQIIQCPFMGEVANIHVTYEVAAINDTAIITAHRR